jgi:DNA polymerase-4
VWGALAQQPADTQISLLAISVSNLVDQASLQLELPLDPGEPTHHSGEVAAARFAVDHSIDEVRRRFGRSAVGYAGVTLGRQHSVPDEFRELAEHEL